MKALPECNIFSKYYWMKHMKQMSTQPNILQTNQNSSMSINELSKPKLNKSKLVKNPRNNAKKPRKQSNASNTKLPRNYKGIKGKTISKSKRKTKQKPRCTNNNKSTMDSIEIDLSNNLPLIHFVHRKHENLKSVINFSDLFEFYPSMVPSDSYRESSASICQSFYFNLNETINTIINLAEKLKLFKSRELQRFSHNLNQEINDQIEILMTFFVTKPFACPNGSRFSNIRQLFEHRSCFNCSPLQKPTHICQCSLEFPSHEDWINHILPRKGKPCIIAMYTFYSIYNDNLPIDTRVYVCNGCGRRSNNFFDNYFHTIYCPDFECNVLHYCNFCTKSTRTEYEKSTCHKTRTTNCVFVESNISNYIKMLSKLFHLQLPSIILSKK